MEVVMAKQTQHRLFQIAIFATFLISLCSSTGPEQGIFTKTVSIPPVAEVTFPIVVCTLV